MRRRVTGASVPRVILAQSSAIPLSDAEVFGLSLAGSLIPALLWLWYFYSRDRYDPEPKRLILKLFLIGAFPVAIISGIVNSLLALVVGIAVTAVVVAPLGEETFKYLGARRGSARNSAFDEPIDGMVYGSTVGLGFAAAETVDYLTAAYTGVDLWTGEADAACSGMECFVVVMVIRGLTSALVHAFASGIAGYFLAQRILAGAPRRTAVTGVLVAAVIHAFWNGSGLLLGLVGLAVAAVLHRALARRALARSPHHGPQILPRTYAKVSSGS